MVVVKKKIEGSYNKFDVQLIRVRWFLIGVVIGVVLTITAILLFLGNGKM